MDGWREWHGGAMPLQKGEMVDVRFRSGRIYYGLRAGYSFSACWEHDNSDGDIVAYRTIRETDERR